MNERTSDKSIQEEAERQQRTLKVEPLETILQVKEICCSSPVPEGWIKVTDNWDPTRCGNPSQIIYNVCVIARYDTMPVGSTLKVCAHAPTPRGWVMIDTFWDPTKCGYPSSIIHNMKQIQRES